MHVLEAIQRPTLILTAQDDPFVPFSTFGHAAIRGNPNIRIVAPRHGGHCGFVSRETGEERFWSEARIVEFCRKQSTL
jgi:predicted alpha/beta-fold hydrolase